MDISFGLAPSAESLRPSLSTVSYETRREIEARKRADTERASRQQQLRQAAKMEAIGRFASGIAHDFNNVLGTIIPFAEALCREATLNPSAKERAQTVFTAAIRGRHIADQILAYGSNQRGERRPTDLCRSVAETLRLVSSALPAGVTLHATMPDAPLVVMGDATQLHQVVMNLCTNAIHAMKDGGKLSVAVATQHFEAECALSHGTLEPGRYVHVSVEDSGCGIDDATLARIFEPFFTTRKCGRGTGLGLAVVYEIVTDFGGAIDVRSAPGEGSTFSVYLPMADASKAAVAHR
jgi:signal transduction histidine kinase